MSSLKDFSDNDNETLDDIDYEGFSPPPPPPPPPPCEGKLENEDSGVCSVELNNNIQPQIHEIISAGPEEIRDIIRSELLPVLEKVEQIASSTEMASHRDSAPYQTVRDVNQPEFHSAPTVRTSNTVRRGVSRDNPDERECLANALQKNVVEIVNDLIFNDSELPDCLLENGCLTDNESIRCRKQADPKDQVRMLLSIIKGRDLSVLKCFLKQIKSHNEHIGLIIEQQFDQNVKQGLKSTVCALCKLKQRVDLKYIADVLYKNFLLEDGLYNMIFQTEKPVGAQDDIWIQVLYWLNDQCRKRKDFVMNVLTEALVQKNHYCQLAKEIERMIKKEHGLVCQCRMKVLKPVSFLSLVSSRSPASSFADSTYSLNLETEPELSDAESLQNLQKPTSVNSNPSLPETDLHHGGYTNLEDQHKPTTDKHVKNLVAKFQKKTPVSSTDAIKVTQEQSKFESIQLRDKNDSKISDKEHEVESNHTGNKQKVSNRQKVICGSDEIKEIIASNAY